MVPARIADKPHYVFHPMRLLRRALYSAHGAGSGGGVALAQLDWGVELEVYSREAIGYSILTTGVFDPCVSETVYRLVDPGDLVVDVGANIGYITSLAAVRAGAGGRVIAYEPHPQVFELLARNVERWRRRPSIAEIATERAAVSARTGTARLASSLRSAENMGLASLHDDDAAADDGVELVEVSVVRLDDALGERSVGLLKIDVEGHEPEVLRGARELLEARRVRDIVFEDHEPYPDACTEIVEGAGYTLLALDNDLLGLRLRGPADRGPLRPWPGPSYLATLDPVRALARLRARGWQLGGIGPRSPWRPRTRN